MPPMAYHHPSRTDSLPTGVGHQIWGPAPLRLRRRAGLLLGGVSLLSAPLLGVGLAWGQDQLSQAQPSAAESSAAPSSSAPAAPAAPPASAGRQIFPVQRYSPFPDAAQPLRPDPASLPQNRSPARFDASLDALVRRGVVSPAERQRIQGGGALRPFDVTAHTKACSRGALTKQECSTGLVVQWRGRLDGQSQLTAGQPGFPGRIGFNGKPITTPLTVPVSALLAGAGGTFRLADVFRVTPRPAPIGGNGNRRLLFPLIGSAITSSSFGYRLHPLLGSWLMHAGRDLAAPEGTPVVAALSGRVVSSGLAGGYGLAVEVEHNHPLRRTLYGHLSELFVKAGDQVRQGEVIGRVGSTGLSTGSHLHFELRLPASGGWVAVDPGDLDPGKDAAGSDAIALLMGQLLQSLERPQSANRQSPPQQQLPVTRG